MNLSESGVECRPATVVIDGGFPAWMRLNIHTSLAHAMVSLEWAMRQRLAPLTV